DAIRGVTTDDTGVENVFACVQAAVEKHRSYVTRKHNKMMVVIWTDESGDDYGRLEDAIRTCRRNAVPVYTVGASSMFGRQQGFKDYKNPEDGKVYALPIDRGPDTARQELLRLPYWFDGGSELVFAGLGPFALTRLARETSGGYFINDQDRDKD